jgi:hypothetical protein
MRGSMAGLHSQGQVHQHRPALASRHRRAAGYGRVTPALKSRNDSPAGAYAWSFWYLPYCWRAPSLQLRGPWLHAPTDRPFADTRAALGTPHLGNVVSKLAFLAAEILGLKLCRDGTRPQPVLSWPVFYVGMALTCCGSAWYHLHPSDAAIAWDRLGMTVAFVSSGIHPGLFARSPSCPPSFFAWPA